MLEELGLYSVDHLKHDHQRGVGSVTYIEKELAVYSFRLISCIRQVVLKLIIGQSCFVEISGVKLLVAGYVNHCKFPIANKLLSSAQSITHEVHSAFIIWWEVKLALYSEYDEQVFLRFYKVS